MAASYLISPGHRAIFIRFWGVATDIEMRSAMQALLGDPRRDPSYVRVSDFRGVTKFDLAADASAT